MKPEEYLTVTALTKYIGRKFSNDPYMQKVYVAGEISNFRQRPGHQYFSLKDDGAKINVAMFKAAFAKVQFQLEEGMRVLAIGRIGVYGPNGNYQMTIERLEPDGVGALYAAFKQLNEKLQKEGLYQLHDGRPLRQYPRRVAVVTSPSGAVIQDIMTTVKRRFPQLQLVLFPAQVQGTAAPADIVRQLAAINQRGDFDAVIIGRGGGSIEDLGPFNDETVARAMAAMTMPVVSSVGHETDVTIADYVADYRAATPTAAAEYVTPFTAVDMAVRIKTTTARLARAQATLVQRNRARLTRATGSVMMTQPERLYDGYVQRVDQLRNRLAQAFPGQLRINRAELTLLLSKLQRVRIDARIAQAQNNVQALRERLGRTTVNQQATMRQRLAAQAEALDHLSPLRTMGRGYAYVTGPDGKMMQKTDDYAVGVSVAIHTTDGQVHATVTAKEKNHG